MIFPVFNVKSLFSQDISLEVPADKNSYWNKLWRVGFTLNAWEIWNFYTVYKKDFSFRFLFYERSNVSSDLKTEFEVQYKSFN